MFFLEKDAELTTERIAKLIRQFETTKQPMLNKYWNYFKGNQEIMRKQPTDVGKPCNRIITNYCYNIVQNYCGYIAGINIGYNSDNDISRIQEVLNYNDVNSEDTELLQQALIFGVCYEINYIDQDGKQRFKLLDSRECIPVYENTLNQELMYVIRYYKVDNFDSNVDKYCVEVYGTHSTKTYNCGSGYSAFVLVDEKPNFFNQVPITVFSLNKDEESIFDKILTLQDAYNKLLSSEVDDFEAFCDAYLVLKGCIAEEEDVAKMKQNRVLVLDETASAEYLTKSISDTQIENMLSNLNDTIHKIANSPDFSDEKLLSQSGIAMRYKLVGFENNASAIEGQMRKALQKRIELISSILTISGEEEVWRDINIIFTRNLPVNVLEIAQTINELRGIVSDETLLAQVPFIKDIDAELSRIKNEKKQMLNVYTFGDDNE